MPRRGARQPANDSSWAQCDVSHFAILPIRSPRPKNVVTDVVIKVLGHRAASGALCGERTHVIDFFAETVNSLTSPPIATCYPDGISRSEDFSMSVQLLRSTATPSKSDADFQITLFISLLGLTATLFALPLFGSDYAVWMAMTG